VGLGFFCSENWTNFENFLEISHDHHLLIQLRTLSQTSFLSEIISFENFASSFGSSSENLRGVDLHESLGVQVLSIVSSDSCFNSEDSLVTWKSQIQNSVIEFGLQGNDICSFRVVLLELIIHSVEHLERKDLFRSRNHVTVSDSDFGVFHTATCDWLIYTFNSPVDIDDGFVWNFSDPLEHWLWGLLGFEADCLASVEVLS